MRKRFLSIIIMTAAAATAFAQHGVGSWNLQPKVGINISNITHSGCDTRVGLAIGAELEYQATGKLSVSMGGIYSQQGGSDGWGADYFNVPVLANYYLSRGFALKAGLQPGFKVSGDGFESTDVSLPLGFSYEVGHVNLEARYNWGLTNVIGDSNHSVFQLTIGYKIPL